MSSFRINFDRKYLRSRAEELVEGRVYAVSNRLSLYVFKSKVSSTWVERGREFDSAWEQHFTDVVPFIKSYNLIYDLHQQLEDISQEEPAWS